jgi:hypothetical protein
MLLHISGNVREMETGRPISGITVEAYDADLFNDNLLGRTQTDDKGHYDVPVKARVGIFLERPDAYVLLKDDMGRTLKSTRSSHLREIDEDVVIDVPLSCYKLLDAGLLRSEELPLEWGDTRPEMLQWSFLTGNGDRVFSEIERELCSKASLLELLAGYMRSLRRGGNDSEATYAKMAKLFSQGSTPRELLGHYYGVALGLRLHPARPMRSRFAHLIGLLWGTSMEDESPWVGKNFSPLDEASLHDLTDQLADPDRRAFVGINHFNRLDWDPGRVASYHALTLWLKLREALAVEREAFAHERNGGQFVATQEPSLCSETPREVFALDYRWPKLHNRAPLSWLVEELVQIGDGLFIGQLLSAGKRRSADATKVDHMGYFALWDERWNREARRLFPFLEIPISAANIGFPEPDQAYRSTR